MCLQLFPFNPQKRNIIHSLWTMVEHNYTLLSSHQSYHFLLSYIKKKQFKLPWYIINPKKKWLGRSKMNPHKLPTLLWKLKLISNFKKQQTPTFYRGTILFFLPTNDSPFLSKPHYPLSLSLSLSLDILSLSFITPNDQLGEKINNEEAITHRQEQQ